jgi:hypothetical protein
MEDKARQLNNCASRFTHRYTEALMILVIKYVEGGSTLVNDLEGDANVESDCEGYGGVNSEKESRAVLITGSFSA